MVGNIFDAKLDRFRIVTKKSAQIKLLIRRFNYLIINELKYHQFTGLVNWLCVSVLDVCLAIYGR